MEYATAIRRKIGKRVFLDIELADSFDSAAETRDEMNFRFNSSGLSSNLECVIVRLEVE